MPFPRPSSCCQFLKNACFPDHYRFWKSLGVIRVPGEFSEGEEEKTDKEREGGRERERERKAERFGAGEKQGEYARGRAKERGKIKQHAQPSQIQQSAYRVEEKVRKRCIVIFRREGRLWNFGGTHKIHKRFLTRVLGVHGLKKEERENMGTVHTHLFWCTLIIWK